MTRTWGTEPAIIIYGSFAFMMTTVSILDALANSDRWSLVLIFIAACLVGATVSAGRLQSSAPYYVGDISTVRRWWYRAVGGRIQSCGCVYGDDRSRPKGEDCESREFWVRKDSGAQWDYVRYIDVMRRCTCCGNHYWETVPYKRYMGYGSTLVERTLWKDEVQPTSIDGVEEIVDEAALQARGVE